MFQSRLRMIVIGKEEVLNLLSRGGDTSILTNLQRSLGSFCYCESGLNIASTWDMAAAKDMFYIFKSYKFDYFLFLVLVLLRRS